MTEPTQAASVESPTRTSASVDSALSAVEIALVDSCAEVGIHPAPSVASFLSRLEEWGYTVTPVPPPAQPEQWPDVRCTACGEALRNDGRGWMSKATNLRCDYSLSGQHILDETVVANRAGEVTLAEAPTDVLCWLAQRPGESFTPAEIAKAVAPPDADNPWLSTLDALHLLRDGLYVSERMNRWEATAEGRAAVVEAMTPAVIGQAWDDMQASLTHTMDLGLTARLDAHAKARPTESEPS